MHDPSVGGGVEWILHTQIDSGLDLTCRGNFLYLRMDFGLNCTEDCTGIFFQCALCLLSSSSSVRATVRIQTIIGT